MLLTHIKDAPELDPYKRTPGEEVQPALKKATISMIDAYVAFGIIWSIGSVLVTGSRWAWTCAARSVACHWQAMVSTNSSVPARPCPTSWAASPGTPMWVQEMGCARHGEDQWLLPASGFQRGAYRLQRQPFTRMGTDGMRAPHQDERSLSSSFANSGTACCDTAGC